MGTVSIGSKITLEKVILLLVMLQVTAVQWLGVTYYYAILINVGMVFLLCKHFGKIQKKGIMFPLGIFVLYCLYHLTMYNNRISVFIRNIYIMGTCMLIVVGMSSLFMNPEKLRKLFVKMFPFINIYMLINIPVLLLQLNDHFELSGRHKAIYTNAFKPDLISGLFGYNGTPMLGAFSTFFFIYCLWYYRNYLKKKNKKIFLVYYFCMLAFYLYISIPNDNKGFYIQLATAYVMYYLVIQGNYTRIREKIHGASKGFLIALLGGVVFVFLYTRSNLFSQMVDIAVGKFLEGITNTNNVSGGAERFAVINYFFKSNINKLVGDGIGIMLWKEEFGYGFMHFGQNDIGSFLLLGGLMLVFIILWFFYKCVYCINKSWFMSIVETIFLLGWMIYTQVLTTPSITISYMLFVLVCGLENLTTNNNNNTRSINLSYKHGVNCYEYPLIKTKWFGDNTYHA